MKKEKKDDLESINKDKRKLMEDDFQYGELF